MNLKELQQRTKDRLQKAWVEDHAREARWLIKHALAVTDADLISGGRPVSPAEADSVESLAARRVNGEPVSRIIGEKDFCGRLFKVTPHVLDPRPDTETIIEAARKRFAGNDPPRRILDLGTGTACILITLLLEFPESEGVGVDLSPEALVVARENAARHGVEKRISFIHGDWALPFCHPERSEGSLLKQIDPSFASLSQDDRETRFDLIVSNPPYIPSGDIPNLENEVKNHDPILALDGGFDGLDAYKKIFSQIKPFFSQAGGGLFEVGILQASDVARLAANAGFLVRGYHADSAGVLRVVEIDSGEN
jgi:release factor glutamine methyltransferase